MLRLAVLALLAANLLFWAYTQGHLMALGLNPTGGREPERLTQQVAADKLVVRNAPRPPAAPDASTTANATAPSDPSPEPASEAPPPEALPPVVPATPSAPPATALQAAGPSACWQATGLSDPQTVLLRGALNNQPDLAPGWSLTEAVLPARWIVYLGKFPNTEALQKRRAELREAKIDHREVSTPALQPGLALGTYSTEEAARRALAQATLNGITNAKAVQERQETRQYTLVLPSITEAQRRRLVSLGVLGDRPLQRCP